MSLVAEMLASKMGAGAPPAADDMPPPGDAPAPDDAAGDPLGTACTDLMASMKAGDVEGMKTAFRAAFMAAEAEEPPEAGALPAPAGEQG